MGIKVGEIDLFKQSLNNEYRILILEIIVEKIISKSPTILTELDLQKIRKDAVTLLQKKYPNSGIKEEET